MDLMEADCLSLKKQDAGEIYTDADYADDIGLLANRIPTS